MHYMIDARLEQRQPELRIIDTENQAIIVDFNTSTLKTLITEGTIYPPDFLYPQDTDIHGLIKEIFLLACAKNAMLNYGTDICLYCRQCEKQHFTINKVF